MKFNIKEFSIISPSEKKSFNTDFKEGINLIIGEKDSGKSSLARAILYTLVNLGEYRCQISLTYILTDSA